MDSPGAHEQSARPSLIPLLSSTEEENASLTQSTHSLSSTIASEQVSVECCAMSERPKAGPSHLTKREKRQQFLKKKREKVAAIRSQRDYAERERKQNRERISQLREDISYTDNNRQRDRGRKRERRQDNDYKEIEKATEKRRKTERRQDSDYRHVENEAEKRRKTERRQDSDYRHVENEAEKHRKTERRQDSDYRHVENEANKSRMMERRQDSDYRHAENKATKSRMMERRQDSDCRHAENEAEKHRKMERRQDSDYKQAEREANKSRMTKQRQDSDYKEAEKEANKSRMTKQRQDSDYKQVEKETEKHRKMEKRRTMKALPAPATGIHVDKTAATNRPETQVGLGDVQPYVLTQLQRPESTQGAVNPHSLQDLEQKTQSEIDKEIRRATVTDYQNLIADGPTCVCTCCGSLWFKNSVQVYNEQAMLDHGLSKDFLEQYCQCAPRLPGMLWICSTCHKALVKGKAPRMSLGHGLQFPELPAELRDLTPLEERLVSPRIPFMQIRPLGIDRQYGLKGNVVNVPVEVSHTVSVLPRSFSNAQTVQLKLMRKMRYRRHYIYETVRPHAVYKAAKFLVNTPLYREHGVTTLAEDWLQEHPAERENFVVDAADMDETDPADEAQQAPAHNGNDNSSDVRQETDVSQQKDKEKEEEEWDETTNDEPLNPGADDTLLDCNEAIRFAPGEGQRPLPVLLDKDCEELAFPTIFAGQRRRQPEKVTYTDIAKSEARRFDRRATKVAKLFFSYKKMEMIRISSSIQTCLRKKTQDKTLKVRDILDPETVGNIVSTDQGFHILRPIRGSPSFWQLRKKELLAMVRQLGCPTFFFTLSAAETKWTELLSVLLKIQLHDDPEPEEIEGLTFSEKAKLIQDDPVTCARYFDHRFRALFTKIIRCKVGPLGEVTDFFYRVEFQHRGSPHIHGLLWIKDAPVFNDCQEESASDVCAFIDRHITCLKPKENQDLFQEVQMQQHKHSHTCLKQSGKDKECRFQIPKFPMSETRILKPIGEDEVQPTDDSLLKKIKDKLKKLPADNTVTLTQFLDDLNSTEEEYLQCIRATLKRQEVFLKREVCEARSNAYNSEILRLWKANMDIQFVLDPYACVMYIINYVGKSQRGMSTLLRSAIADVRKGNGTIREKLRAVANCFLNSSEISAQETCYYLLGMPVTQSSRSCVFINTNRPEKRVRMLKSEKNLKDMDPNSTDVMCSGLLEKYAARPQSMEDVCLAKFAADYNINGNDPALNIPHEDEDNTEDRTGNTKQRITLDKGEGYISKRKWSKIIRYCNFDKLKDEEEYYREQLMLFLPWRDEERDIINIDHETKYKAHLEIISDVRNLFVSNCARSIRDAEEQQNALDDDDDMLEGIVPVADLDAEELGPDVPEDFQALEDAQGRQVDVLEQLGQPVPQEHWDRFLAPGHISDDEFEHLLSTLNSTQSKYISHCVHAFKTGKLPLFEFISGGAGVGKSRLIKVLHQSLIRYFNSIPGANPDDITVLLCAPTGKAAFNIGGMTLHAALSLPLSQYGGSMPKLGADVSNTIASKLHKLKLIIIDEISMVGAKMLNAVHTRLCQIFKSSTPFGGISIVAVGDFQQLPPVADSFPFKSPPSNNMYTELAGPVLWNNFHLIELTQIMRQREDLSFAQALSNLAKGELTDEERNLFKSREVLPSDVPNNTLQLFATNIEVSRYNEEALKKLNTEGAVSLAMDTCQGDASEAVKASFMEYVSGLSTSETCGLPFKLDLKVTAKYMMTINVDTADGLVNGATGTLQRIDYSQGAQTTKAVRVWIDFDDPDVGKSARGKNSHMARRLSIPPTLTPVDLICRVARRKQGGGNLQILRKQFPLVPAMAITIHKSQGDTYTRVAVNLKRGMKRASLYVACSRAKSAQGLYLIGEFQSPAKPAANDAVVVEMNRLRQHKPVVYSMHFLDEICIQHGLKIVFHNVQSLQKHFPSTAADRSVMAADLLLFVETRLSVKGSVQFPGFACVFEGLFNPYGMSVYARLGIPCTDFEHTVKHSQGHIEVTTLSIDKDGQKTVVCVVYKSPPTPQRQLTETLAQSLDKVLPTADRVMCVGDFNIDRKKPEGNSLLKFMEDRSLFPLLTNDAVTTNQGTQIDQCFSNVTSALAGTGESMTSYHKPVWVIL